MSEQISYLPEEHYIDYSSAYPEEAASEPYFQEVTAPVDAPTPPDKAQETVTQTYDQIETLRSGFDAEGGLENETLQASFVDLAEDYASGVFHDSEIVLIDPDIAFNVERVLSYRSSQLMMDGTTETSEQTAHRVMNIVENADLSDARQEAKVALANEMSGRSVLLNTVDAIGGVATAATNLAQGLAIGATKPFQLAGAVYNNREVAGEAIIGMAQAGAERYLDDVNSLSRTLANGEEQTIGTDLKAATSTVAHYATNILGDALTPIYQAKDGKITPGEAAGLVVAEVLDPVDMVVGAKAVDAAHSVPKPDLKLPAMPDIKGAWDKFLTTGDSFADFLLGDNNSAYASANGAPLDTSKADDLTPNYMASKGNSGENSKLDPKQQHLRALKAHKKEIEENLAELRGKLLASQAPYIPPTPELKFQIQQVFDLNLDDYMHEGPDNTQSFKATHFIRDLVGTDGNGELNIVKQAMKDQGYNDDAIALFVSLIANY